MKRIWCLITALYLSLLMEAKPGQDFDTVVYNTTATFAQMLQLVKQKHYKVEDLESCMYVAFDAFMSYLDPHSSFLCPKSYKNILTTMSGEFCGIGVVIDVTRQKKDRFLTIVDTIPDGPAEKAGIKPFDKIVEIDGIVLEGMSTEEATAKLKGKQGSTTLIKIIRENKGVEKSDLLTFSIVRDVIKEHNSRSFLLNDCNICYIGFTMFAENSVNQIEQLLDEAHKKKYKGIILDLRNNSGGLLQAAIDIAGLFVEKGSLVVVTKDKNGKEIERCITKRKPIEYSTPFIIILINNYTASAAEILAGCLKNHSSSNKKAADKPVVVLVGTKTFGKGSVQEIIPINDDCAVKITTSLYYLPDGTSIQGIGIEPDINVERMAPLPEQISWFNAKYGREESLANYIRQENQHNNTQEKTPKKEPGTDTKGFLERLKENLVLDNQFQEAITIINTLNTIKSLAPKQVNTRQATVDFLVRNYRSNKKIELTEIRPAQSFDRN